MADREASFPEYFLWDTATFCASDLGYRPKFGIIEVDRTTFTRSSKPSPAWYANATRTFFTTA